VLEEGLTEAGSMASLQAAGTAYATHGIPMIPFYLTYSMFGMQRTSDSIWSFGDIRGRGFLLGATAGRTTLNGEGLQHQDGHSHLFAFAFPNVRAYDPAYACEIAVIVRDGLRRMLEEEEDCLYYISLYNETYLMPPLVEGSEEGIIAGIYRLPAALAAPKKPVGTVQLFGSGSILQQCVLEAARILIEDFKVAAPVWSVTSYQQLFRDARACARHNRFVPKSKEKKSYIQKALKGVKGPIIAASDWVQEIPASLTPYIEQPYVTLGTNGLGRSDTREALRSHFEIDAGSIVVAALSSLSKEGGLEWSVVKGAMKRFGIDPAKKDSMGS
jgi:pyruvate dehydrogenase E1 component